MQHESLKALARAALERNTQRNSDATDTPKLRNKQGQKTPPVVAQIFDARERLLAIARELGLPDALVLELPEGEINATAEQSTWYADAEVRHRLLVFYLRSLAGIEPALPGSVAERHQAERQAHVRALRTGSGGAA